MWEAEKKQLRDQKIEACIGLKDDEDLVGVLLLGEKKGHKKLDNNDLKLLNSIASVAQLRSKMHGFMSRLITRHGQMN